MTTALETRIRAVLDEKSLLRHPFYREWSAGTLPRERLQEYARQYYHFEAAFPRFLSALHTRAESPSIRQLLLENLWDEEHGPRNHVALWLEFAAAVGANKASVVTSKPNAETAGLVNAFMEICQTGPLGEALATLFAYEGQVPAIAWEKIKGLSEHYQMSPDKFEFFSVHLVSDVAHAGAEMQAIAELTIEEDAVVAAASKSCDLLWRFLDGCSAPAASRN